MATAAACFKCVQRGKSWTFSRWETGMCEGLTNDVRGQNKRVFVNLPIYAPARGKHWKKKTESCRLRSPRTHSRFLHFIRLPCFQVLHSAKTVSLPGMLSYSNHLKYACALTGGDNLSFGIHVILSGWLFIMIIFCYFGDSGRVENGPGIHEGLLIPASSGTDRLFKCGRHS